MELLFGGMPDLARFVVAFMLVLGLIGAGALLWRRFGAGPLSPIGPRGRQPRLAVIDVTCIDARRQLVLIRRDNTEHLLMIGGPTDIVVEPNIARTGASPVSRDPRPIPTADASRQPISGESPDWALPLEPLARSVRTVEDLDAVALEPPPRTAREAMADSMRAVRSDAAVRRSSATELRTQGENEISAPPLTAPPSPVEASFRTQVASEPRRAPQPPSQPNYEPVFQAAQPDPQRTAPEPAPVPQSSDSTEAKRTGSLPPRQLQSDETNLAEMAQRLEAALRRPTKPAEGPASPPATARPARPTEGPASPPATARPAKPVEPPAPPAVPSPAPARPAARLEPAAVRKSAYLDSVNTPKGSAKSPEPSPASPPDLKILSGKPKAEPQPPFESLEDEMAKMLGRSPGKS